MTLFPMHQDSKKKMTTVLASLAAMIFLMGYCYGVLRFWYFVADTLVTATYPPSPEPVAQNLLELTDDCNFQCFNGFTIGDATLDEAIEFMREKYNTPYILLDGNLSPNEAVLSYAEPIGVGFSASSDDLVIDEIVAYTANSVESIISALGTPEVILVGANGYGFSWIELYYPSSGYYFRTTFWSTISLINDATEICINEDTVMEIVTIHHSINIEDTELHQNPDYEYERYKLHSWSGYGCNEYFEDRYSGTRIQSLLVPADS